MKCISCNQEIAEGSSYCGYCGAEQTNQEIPKEATAGVGWRFVATVVDGIILFLLGYVLALITGETTEGGFNLQGGSAFLWFFIGLVYYTVLEAMFGATAGKMVCGLQVVKTDRSAVDWKASVIRNVLRIIDGLFAYLVGAIFVWSSPMRQRLGDRAAATVVVKKSRLS